MDWWKVNSDGTSDSFARVPSSSEVIWSNNKQRLLYGFDGDLWLLNIQTQVTTNLTHTTDAEEFDAAWSPDDRQVAFVRRLNSVPYSEDVWSLDLVTGQERNLTHSSGRVERGFCCDSEVFEQVIWSPYSPNLIYFASDVPKTPSWGPPQGDSDFFPGLVNLNGSGYRIIDSHNGSFFPPSVSANGHYLAYDGGNFSTVGGFLYDLKTSELIPFLPAEYGLPSSLQVPSYTQLVSPRWSPDGKKLLWMGMRSDYKVGIILFDLEKRSAKILTSYDPFYFNLMLPPGHRWPDNNIQWSPDGNWIAIVTDSPDLHENDLQYAGHLQIFDKLGQLIAETRAGYGRPVWSPDKESLAFNYLEFNNKAQYNYNAVRVVNVKTNQLTELELPRFSQLLGWLP